VLHGAFVVIDEQGDGTKTGASRCFNRSNWIAPAMALAVQLPSWPWSYTGGHWGRKSMLTGKTAAGATGAA
jgi:hypothetical protein